MSNSLSPTCSDSSALPTSGSKKRPRLDLDSEHSNFVSCPPPPLPPRGIHLAPMVRGSELAMRQLARNHGGASLCYGPMLRDHEVVAVHKIWQKQQQQQHKTNSNGTTASANSDEKQEEPPIDLWSRNVPMDKAGRVINALSETAYLLFHDTSASDAANLVVQICGSRPSTLGKATTAVLDIYAKLHNGQLPVGIDLNLGCPQRCAERGNFGAFLVERDHDGVEVHQCIKAMRLAIEDFCANTNPNGNKVKGHRPRLSAKMRLLETTEDTINFCEKLREAGCDCIAVHCRRRTEKHDGPPDWRAGTNLVDALDAFPIILNGGICNASDAESIIEQTKCHAVMVAQGYLQNHRMFDARTRNCSFLNSPAHLAAEYLDYAERYPPPCYLYIQKHLRWVFRRELQPEDDRKVDYTDWRPRLWGFLVRSYLRTVEQFRLVVALYVKLSTENFDGGIGDGTTCTCTCRSSSAVPASIMHLVKNVSFKTVKKAGQGKTNSAS